jgi:hypothetical protein
LYFGASLAKAIFKEILSLALRAVDSTRTCQAILIGIARKAFSPLKIILIILALRTLACCGVTSYTIFDAHA